MKGVLPQPSISVNGREGPRVTRETIQWPKGIQRIVLQKKSENTVADTWYG